jgi:hydroxymethylglutaryl-CoA lyase
MALAKRIQIIEVGLRDGLQNESLILDIGTKLELTQFLARAGLDRIEIGSFVSPKWIPAMADSDKLIAEVQSLVKKKKISSKVQFSALVPNEKGMELALNSGIQEVAIFAASSETFSQKNINCSIDESFNRFLPVLKIARANKIKVRGYLSTCFGCPYEGPVSESRVVQLAQRMFDLGVFEISIGDTIGVANPKQVQSLMKKLIKKFQAKKIAGHFHDTRGTALVNIYASYELGITHFDSSIGGLGGCPYAKGSTGNVATEDVVYMFHGMGVNTGLNGVNVKLHQLIKTTQWLSQKMQKKLPSKVSAAAAEE